MDMNASFFTRKEEQTERTITQNCWSHPCTLTDCDEHGSIGFALAALKR